MKSDQATILQRDIDYRYSNGRRTTASLPKAELLTEQSKEKVAHHGHWHQKEQCIIVPVIQIMSRNNVITSIMGIVKLDVILEKSSAEAGMSEMSVK